MTRQDRPQAIFDAPPLQQMPLLSPEAAGVIHAHLPPPNVEQYIAPAAATTPAEVHSSAHTGDTKKDMATKCAELKP